MKLHLIAFLLTLSACKSVETTTCVSAPSITSVLPKNIAFTYDHNTSIDLDIDGDGTQDFRCTAKPAGNRIAKTIVPLHTSNRITSCTTLLASGDMVDSNQSFQTEVNFNNLGNGMQAELTDQYLGVEFISSGRLHYGWIKFSSTTGNTPDNYTPVYYLNLALEIHETAYNEACEQPIQIQ